MGTRGTVSASLWRSTDRSWYRRACGCWPRIVAPFFLPSVLAPILTTLWRLLAGEIGSGLLRAALDRLRARSPGLSVCPSVRLSLSLCTYVSAVSYTHGLYVSLSLSLSIYLKHVYTPLLTPILLRSTHAQPPSPSCHCSDTTHTHTHTHTQSGSVPSLNTCCKRKPK